MPDHSLPFTYSSMGDIFSSGGYDNDQTMAGGKRNCDNDYAGTPDATPVTQGASNSDSEAGSNIWFQASDAESLVNLFDSEEDMKLPQPGSLMASPQKMTALPGGPPMAGAHVVQPAIQEVSEVPQSQQLSAYGNSFNMPTSSSSAILTYTSGYPLVAYEQSRFVGTGESPQIYTMSASGHQPEMIAPKTYAGQIDFGSGYGNGGPTPPLQPTSPQPILDVWSTVPQGNTPGSQVSLPAGTSMPPGVTPTLSDQHTTTTCPLLPDGVTLLFQDNYRGAYAEEITECYIDFNGYNIGAAADGRVVNLPDHDKDAFAGCPEDQRRGDKISIRLLVKIPGQTLAWPEFKYGQIRPGPNRSTLLKKIAVQIADYVKKNTCYYLQGVRVTPYDLTLLWLRRVGQGSWQPGIGIIHH